jgi:murein DD-endopeptidase MepM/ murein hydrolase activator NlpD
MAGAFLARLLFSMLIAAACAAPVGAGLQDYPFRVESEEKDGGHELVAQNEGPAPITVRVVLTERENVASDRQWPVTAVVPPNQSLVLARLFRASPLAGYRFSFKYRHQFGDIAAVHDATATYRLPFDDGRSFLISQAYGGVMTTHTGPENAHAVDIVMPERTPVVAARAGMVIDIENFHVRGGTEAELLDKANSVTILHDDGTMARYVHLDAGQYSWIGEQVEAGTHIGYSGNTGYTSGPHLHFVVIRAQQNADGSVSYVSVPVKFYAYDPPVSFMPQQGMVVTSNYDSPGSPPPVLPIGLDRARVPR